MARCRGGYAVTVLINGYGILAFRDPHGVRPLCLGSRPGGGADGSSIIGGGAAALAGGAVGGGGADGRGGSGKMDLAVASESAALTGLGFSLKRDVGAGEAVFLDVRTGSVASRICGPRRRRGGGGEGSGDGAVGRIGEQGRGQEASEKGVLAARFKPCLFEYVYMARPDSIIDGVPVCHVFGGFACFCFVIFVVAFGFFTCVAFAWYCCCF